MAIDIHHRMTAADFLALPEDGIDRELVRGEVRERPSAIRNFRHSECLINLGSMALNWARSQRPRAFRVFGGETGFRFPDGENTVVGMDLAIVSTDVMESQAGRSRIIEGLPVLAVEILSPSDTHEDVFEKTQLYLEAGIPLVWIVDPDERTVKVHRPGRPPQLVHEQQSMTADPELPGFSFPLVELFEML